MLLFEEAINELDDLADRDPRKFPYGFYLVDDCKQETSGSGGFTWHTTEKDMIDSLKRILIGLLSEDEDINLEQAGSSLSEIFKPDINNLVSEARHKMLTDYLFDIGSPVRCDFLGSFKDLCIGESEWVRDVRHDFRWAVLDDAENIPDEEIGNPIMNHEVDDFIEYISTYGL